VLGDVETIVTVGAVLSIVYAWPVVKLPLPAPGPSSGFVARSAIEASSFRSRRRVPSPLPVFAVTVQVVPEPPALETAAPPRPPVAVNAKSEVSTPVTPSLRVTSQPTLEALVGFVVLAARLT
jgi:hypothetical protein